MTGTDTISQQVYDLLVSRNFDPAALDSSGRPAESPADAELFSFEYKTESQNYGTVVVLLDNNENLEVYFGDNLGRTMQRDDKSVWYDFLYTLRMLAKRNLYGFGLQNLNRLKYNMKTMAAVQEGTLLEGYYGTRKTSYRDQPDRTRLIIKHTRPLGKTDARYRNIDSIFVETEEGERFKMPFRNISAGKAMARHVAEGGTPYDAFGQHISEMVAEIDTLSRFIRATRNRDLQESAAGLREQAVEHYKRLKRKVKRIIGRRGYQEEREQFDPFSVSVADETVDRVRGSFVDDSLDTRIEEAVPFLARMAVAGAGAARSDYKESKMKEINEFESWANSIVEGVSIEDEIEKIMSEPVPVGVDGLNAVSILGDISIDENLDDLYAQLAALADEDPDADARTTIADYFNQIGYDIDVPQAEEKDIDSGREVVQAQRDPMLESKLAELRKLIK